jgi:uncharacterized LabA/DUF88 family protein
LSTQWILERFYLQNGSNKGMKKENNYAFIDGANLHRGINGLGWKLDYQRFRIWLKEKYNINNAYIFLGLVPKNTELYTYLQNSGFILIFKETTYDGVGNIKGNCDADLVLCAVCGYYEKKFDKAVIVSSDGDYASLIIFLKNKNVFHTLLSPHMKCSFLLRKLNISIVYLDTQKSNIFLDKKAPGKDETLQGSFS